MRLTSWLVVLIAVLAIFVDIPKHQFSFPFNCPGICLRIGDLQINQEIKTHLGLDLQGGTQLILRLQFEKLPPGSNATQSELQNQAINVIERRINAVGVSEPVVQGLGTDKILLELPGVTDIQQANDVATRQAFLEIKVPAGPDKPGEYKSLEPPLTGADLNPNGVYVTFQGTEPVVAFEFAGAAGDRWVQISKDYLNQPVQITLDTQEISAPVIQQVFSSGSGIIEGRFTTKTANDLVIQLKSGSLPVPLEVIQSSRIEPTLGRDSVQQSVVAGIIGLLLVAFFMIAYYRLPGVLAVLALLYYAALTYAIFRLVPVTLTLAGVAGFLLSIGMAADANVLTFERLKEELRTGKSLRAAVEEGRKRAFPSIFYSNLATIMTAGVLFWFGSGTVKGFALTLAIGVFVSFFTAVIVTQMLLQGAIEFPALRKRRLWGVEERPADTRGTPPAAVAATASR
jgi:preprotein translocase subunit SecD